MGKRKRLQIQNVGFPFSIRTTLNKLIDFEDLVIVLQNSVPCRSHINNVNIIQFHGSSAGVEGLNISLMEEW